MRLIPVEGPIIPAVSLDEMKAHLNVTHNDDDDLIEAYTAAATEEIDGIAGIGRALVSQTWDLYLSGFCNDPIEIPLPPMIGIEHVKYYDEDNVQQTLADTVYEVIGAGGHSPAHFVLKHDQSWPSVYNRSEPVVIRFRAGYVDTDDSPPQTGQIPPKLIAAIKLQTGTLYMQRETIVLGQSVALVPAAERLVAKYIVYSF